MAQRKAAFDLKHSSDDQFYFLLVAPNGEPIAYSERYTTTRAAENGIDAVRKYAPVAATDDQT
ncbi:MAG: YegP family protein [Albidovulum sp.]|nr:YegP family protein [Albidovulum sp.]